MMLHLLLGVDLPTSLGKTNNEKKYEVEEARLETRSNKEVSV